jgi:hypothetical protein
LWLQKNFRSDQEFLENSYGIKRLKGMVRFMESEDWSQRMPQFIEYINNMDAIRGTQFCKTFPEMAALLDEPLTERPRSQPRL